MKTLSGEIAQPDGTLTRGQITFSDRIIDVHAAPTQSDDYILPGFVDLQVNGSHGIDGMAASPAALAELGRHLALEGTTSWLPTGVTSPVDRLRRVHDAIAEAGAPDTPARSATILGMHMEGPFISLSRLGAHPQLNLEPHGEQFEQLSSLPGLRLITLAPELPFALAAIDRLTARGAAVSIGHTNATLEGNPRRRRGRSCYPCFQRDAPAEPSRPG